MVSVAKEKSNVNKTLNHYVFEQIFVHSGGC